MQLAALLSLGFYVVVQTWADVNSIVADKATDGVAIDPREVWALELTSLLAWMVVAAAVWRMVARLRPPRFGWPAIIAGHAIGAVVGSLVHVALMVAMRKVVWWAGGADYIFAGALGDALLYEARKDIATYAEMTLLFAMIQWVGNNAARLGLGREDVIEVRDGSRLHRIPVREIEGIAAAANYCAIDWNGRTVLHRATLASLADELSDKGFVQVHRGRLVRRDAIRTTRHLASGDANLELASGAVVRASRRYRSAWNDSA